MARFPFFDLTRQYQTIKNEVMEVIPKLFEKQTFIGGEEVVNLEKELAAYVGVKHAITCSDGTDALIIALHALDIGPGDEVITPAYSFFASTGSILACHARPVFVDIDPHTFNIDPKLIESKITLKTKAIMPVHLFGQCADMESVMSIANKHQIPVVEDAAQAIGARYSGRGAGSMGSIGCFSFYPTKNLGGAGEGGMVTTDDDTLAEKLRLIKVHGMKVRYYHDILGWNSRLDSIQAAVLRIKLRHLDKWVGRRQQLARQYEALLDRGVKAGAIILPHAGRGQFHVWNQYCVMVRGRDRVRKELEAKGYPTEVYYPLTIPEQKILKDMGYPSKGWPLSEAAAAGSLALPIFPELTDAEQKEFAEALVETAVSAH